jgi:hypothetical protein
MNIVSVKQYVKYAAPLVAIVFVATSAIAAPFVKSQNTHAANDWTTVEGCKKEATTTSPDTFVTTCINNRSVEGMVFRVYRSVLNRNPDTAGYKYWVSVANANRSKDPVASVVKGLIGSQEARNKGVLTENTQVFVTELYQKSLNRKPDAAGYKYWVNEINRMDGKRKTHEAVIGSFAQSTEAKRVWSLEAPCYVTNYSKQYCAN